MATKKEKMKNGFGFEDTDGQPVYPSQKTRHDITTMTTATTINTNNFLKDLLTKSARRKDVQNSSDISVYNTINREKVRSSRSRRWYIILYNVPTTTSRAPNLFPVDGVVHRNIGTVLYVFSSRAFGQ